MGPERPKYEVPKITRERYKDIPEIAAQFSPDIHPNMQMKK